MGRIVPILCVAGVLASDAAQKPNTAAPPAPGANELSVPAPPIAKSPIDYFRELLALSPEEREQRLADKPENQRQSIRAKLQEYASLNPEERDARLRATELRWYLRPLMEQAPTNRLSLVVTVPGSVRSLVEARLQQWDLLRPEVQKEILENERLIRYFVPTAPRSWGTVRVEVSPKRLEELETALVRWRKLPIEQRQRMCIRFRQFFELSPSERTRTLSGLSDEEHKQMEATLKAFEKLPPAQREVCINSFRKLANLEP